MPKRKSTTGGKEATHVTNQKKTRNLRADASEVIHETETTNITLPVDETGAILAIEMKNTNANEVTRERESRGITTHPDTV
jgi:hypothetical protein